MRIRYLEIIASDVDTDRQLVLTPLNVELLPLQLHVASDAGDGQRTFSAI